MTEWDERGAAEAGMPDPGRRKSGGDGERTDGSAEDLSRELERIFAGDRGPLAGRLVAPGRAAPDGDGGGFRPVSRLFEAGALERVLEDFGGAYPGADERAVASLWCQWYLSALVVPAVTAGLLLERTLPLGRDQAEVALDPGTHHPVAFRLPHAGVREPDADPFRRFGPLLGRHVAPLVQEVASRCGLATGLLWSSAGSYLEWALRKLAEDEDGDGAGDGGDPSGEGPQAGEAAEETPRAAEATTGGGEAPRARSREAVAAEARRAAETLLEAPRWPDGRPNPLRGSVRWVEEDGEEVRRRRVCCLRYLLPGVRGCGSLCPLPHVRAGAG